MCIIDIQNDMAVNVAIGSKFKESSIIADKRFAEYPSLDKKLNNFRENLKWFFKNEEA